MAESHHVSILDHFDDLDDPRVERTRRHQLVDILAIAICAAICGADSWVHDRNSGQAGASWNGLSNLPWNCPTASPPMTPGIGDVALREGSLEPRRRSEKALLSVIQQAYVEGVQELLSSVLDPGHRWTVVELLDPDPAGAS